MAWIPIPNPEAQSGGTREMLMEVPAAVLTVSCGFRVTNAAVRAQKVATMRSSTVGEVRAATSAVTSWKGSIRVSTPASSTTTSTLSPIRMADRSASSAEPTASPIASSTIGPMSGATSIAPMMTAPLSSTSPNVAIPAARTS